MSQTNTKSKITTDLKVKLVKNLQNHSEQKSKPKTKILDYFTRNTNLAAVSSSTVSSASLTNSNGSLSKKSLKSASSICSITSSSTNPKVDTLRGRKRKELKNDTLADSQTSAKKRELSSSTAFYNGDLLFVSNTAASADDSLSVNSVITSTISNRSCDTTSDVETYRIGDWVFCEYDSNQPYSIRKIEEFFRKPDGQIEAKLRCAFRRTDISPSLLILLEKRFSQYFTTTYSTLAITGIKSELDSEAAATNSAVASNIISPHTQSTNSDKEDEDQAAIEANNKIISLIQTLTPSQLYHLRHRELFYSKYYESNVSTGCFRGKLSLNLFLPDVNTFDEYLTTPSSTKSSVNIDRFFYQIAYDPNKNMISDDKVLIRVGPKFQADIPELTRKPTRKTNTSDRSYYPFEREVLVWDGPKSCEQCSDITMKKYLTKVVETKLRSNENYKDCEINETRDCIKYNAIRHLHASGYDRSEALRTFKFNKISSSPTHSPMHQFRTTATALNSEENQTACIWSSCEIKFFENGIKQFGKDFFQIQKHYFPNKSLSSIVDYYYNAYKINDVYIDKREEKRQTKKNKLVELTIPKTNFYSSSSSSSLSAFNTSHHHYSYFDEYYDADNNDSIMLDDDIMEQTQTNVSSLAATNPSDTTRALCVSCQKQKPVNSFNRYTNQAVTNPFSTNSNSSTSLVNRLSPVSFPIAAAPLVVREQHHVEEKLRIVENNRNSLFNKQFFQLNINAATATGSSSSSNFSQSSSKTTENMCNNCWIYWKKYGSFKNNFNEINALKNSTNSERSCPEKRKERNKNQTYTCQLDYCGKSFAKKNDFSRHVTFSHCQLVKSVVTHPPTCKPLVNFCLHTTPITRATQVVYGRCFLQKLARHPCSTTQSVDYRDVRTVCGAESTAIKLQLDKSKKRKLNKIKALKLRPKRSSIESNTPSPSAKSSSASSSPSNSNTNFSSVSSSSSTLASLRLHTILSSKNLSSQRHCPQSQKRTSSQNSTIRFNIKPETLSNAAVGLSKSGGSIPVRNIQNINSNASAQQQHGLNEIYLRVSNLNLKLIKSLSQQQQQQTPSKENKYRGKSSDDAHHWRRLNSSGSSMGGCLMLSSPSSMSVSSASSLHNTPSSTSNNSSVLNQSSSSANIKLSLRFHNNSNGQRVGMVVESSHGITPKSELEKNEHDQFACNLKHDDRSTLGSGQLWFKQYKKDNTDDDLEFADECETNTNNSKDLIKELAEINSKIRSQYSIDNCQKALSINTKVDWFFKSNSKIKRNRQKLIKTDELRRLALGGTKYSNRKLYNEIRRESREKNDSSRAKENLQHATKIYFTLQKKLDEKRVKICFKE